MNLHFNQPANKQRFTNLTPHSTKQNHKADSVRHSVSVSRCKNQKFLMKNSKNANFSSDSCEAIIFQGNRGISQSNDWMDNDWTHCILFGLVDRWFYHAFSYICHLCTCLYQINASLFHRFVDQMATIWHLLTEKELYRYFWYAFPPNVNIHVFSSSCTNHPPNVSRSVVVWEYRRLRTICSCNWRSALCVEAENNNK